MSKSIFGKIVVASIVLLSSVTGYCAKQLKIVFTDERLKKSYERYFQEYEKHRSGSIKVLVTCPKSEAQWMNVFAGKADIYWGYPARVRDNIDIDTIEDLSKLMPTNTLKDFIPGYVEAFRINKKLYGIPAKGIGYHLFANRHLFGKAGLPLPNSNWTWESSFYQSSLKLTIDLNGDGLPDQYGVYGTVWTGLDETLLFSYGGDVLDKAQKKVVYADNPGIDALNFFVKLHNEKLAEIPSYAYKEKDISTWGFFNGKSAMSLGGGIPGYEPTYYKKKGIQFDLVTAPVPKGPKGSVPLLSSDIISIIKGSPNKKEAIEFIKYFASSKGQSLVYDLLPYYDDMPSLPTTYSGMKYGKVVNMVDKPILNSYLLGKATNMSKTYSELLRQMKQDLELVISGDAVLSDLVDNAKTIGKDTLDMYSSQ